jgi:hypothetical protein
LIIKEAAASKEPPSNIAAQDRKLKGKRPGLRLTSNSISHSEIGVEGTKYAVNEQLWT